MFPFEIFGLSVLCGVLACDLVFDAAPRALSAPYYTGQRGAAFPESLIVPAFILLGFAPLFYKVATGAGTGRSVYNLITAIAGLIGIAIFVAILIPNQETVRELGDVAAAESHLAIIRLWHLVLVPIVFGGAILQGLQLSAAGSAKQRTA